MPRPDEQKEILSSLPLEVRRALRSLFRRVAVRPLPRQQIDSRQAIDDRHLQRSAENIAHIFGCGNISTAVADVHCRTMICKDERLPSRGLLPLSSPLAPPDGGGIACSWLEHTYLYERLAWLPWRPTCRRHSIIQAWMLLLLIQRCVALTSKLIERFSTESTALKHH